MKNKIILTLIPLGLCGCNDVDKELVLATNTEECLKAAESLGDLMKRLHNGNVDFRVCCENLYREQISVMSNKEIREHARKIKENKADYSRWATSDEHHILFYPSKRVQKLCQREGLYRVAPEKPLRVKND